MNLQQTIDELEKQAAQYTEAANALRALLGTGQDSGASPARPAAREGAARQRGAAKAGARRSGKAAGKGGGRRGKRGPVSAETRAKISEKLRARHAERKARSQ